MPESREPSPPERQPDPAAPVKPADAATRPRPRANPPTAAQMQQAAQQAQQAQQTGGLSLNDLVNLARSLSGEEAPPPAPSAPSRTLISRDQKKFSRQKSRPFGEPPEAADSPDAAAAEPEELLKLPTAASSAVAVDPADAAPAPAPLKKSGGSAPVTFARSGGGGQSRRGRRNAWMPFILAQLAVLAVAFIGWQILHPSREGSGTSSSSRGAASSVDGSPRTPTPISPRATEMIDRLVEAEKAGDLRKALDLCEQIRRVDPHVPGLDYRQAVLSAKAGDGPEIMISLNRSLVAGEELINSHNLIAALMLRQGKLTTAIHEYEAAAQAGPFEDKPYFYWGEALRRAGQPQAALVRLNQAIDRAREPADEALYRSKVRLTLIEMNRDRELADEIKEKLALNPPPAEWLLTAAAVELHNGKIDAAGGYLDQVSKMVPPKVMENWLRDYFFYGFAREKKLARFYGALAPPPSVVPPPEASPSAAGSPSPSPGLPEGGAQSGQMISPVAPAVLSAPAPKPSASPAASPGR